MTILAIILFNIITLYILIQLDFYANSQSHKLFLNFNRVEYVSFAHLMFIVTFIFIAGFYLPDDIELNIGNALVSISVYICLMVFNCYSMSTYTKWMNRKMHEHFFLQSDYINSLGKNSSLSTKDLEIVNKKIREHYIYNEKIQTFGSIYDENLISFDNIHGASVRVSLEASPISYIYISVNSNKNKLLNYFMLKGFLNYRLVKHRDEIVAALVIDDSYIKFSTIYKNMNIDSVFEIDSNTFSILEMTCI